MPLRHSAYAMDQSKTEVPQKSLLPETSGGPAAAEAAVEPIVEIPLTLYWDEWSRCIGSRYQRDHLYRVGRLDGCRHQWNDLKTAGKAKFLQFKDPQECKKMMDSTYYRKRQTISPTAGAIWELKETPGWD